MKIAVIGTHGIGKTTLCYDIAAMLKKKGMNVDIVKEVARSCPLPVNKQTTKDAQAWILHTQITREIEAANAGDAVVCDRSVMDNYAYLVHKEGRDEILEKLVKEWMKTYDFVFKLPVSGELKNDNFRETDQEWQIAIDRLIESLAGELGIKYIELGGDKSSWAAQIMDNVEKMNNMQKESAV